MAVLSTNVEYAEYDFSEAYIETKGTLAAASGASTNKLTYNAHGLNNGDVVSLADISGLSLVTAATRYYVVNKATNDFQVAATPGGSAIAIGNSGSADVYYIKRWRLYYPNKVTPTNDTNKYEWKGGGRVLKLDQLAAQQLALESATVPQYVHSNIFSKDSLTFQDGALTGSNAIGVGGGNDKNGVTVGMYLKCYAKKLVNGSEVGVVTRFYWYPTGTLTMTAARGLESGANGPLQGYTFNATPGNADIMGATIAGFNSDEYYMTGEIA